MKEPNDSGKLDKDSGSIDEFEKRARRILDRLDKANEIFDNIQTSKTKQKKPDKVAEIFQDISESIERGVKKLFSALSSQDTKPIDDRDRPRSLIPKHLTRYLWSCSDEQLAAIRNEIDRILRERNST